MENSESEIWCLEGRHTGVWEGAAHRGDRKGTQMG